MDMEKLNIR